MAPKHIAYYELFGVSPTATQAQLKKAYRLKALRHHPDRNGNTKEATEAFQHLKAVYEILADADRRAAYDEHGPVDNVHGDDDGIDADSLSAFFARQKPISVDDIIAYETTYRDGPDEREDLEQHFLRFEGDVRQAVHYIPYSDESDLKRFVLFWDGKIEKGELDNSDRWKEARKTLLRASKGKERDLTSDLKTVDKEADPATKKKSSSKRAAKKKAKEDDLAGLTALIQARGQKNKASFDAWCAKIEEEERAGGSPSESSPTPASTKGSRSRKTAKSKTKGRASGKRTSPERASDDQTAEQPRKRRLVRK